jgi:hypothetical protein
MDYMDEVVVPAAKPSPPGQKRVPVARVKISGSVPTKTEHFRSRKKMRIPK